MGKSIFQFETNHFLHRKKHFSATQLLHVGQQLEIGAKEGVAVTGAVKAAIYTERHPS